MQSLRTFAEREADEKPKRVHFVFFASPVEILGDTRVEAIRFERTRVENGRAIGTGEHFKIACGLVVAAVGYLSMPVDGAPFDHKQGVVRERRGPGSSPASTRSAGSSGAPPGSSAPTSRMAGTPPGRSSTIWGRAAGKPGREGLEAMLRARGRRWIDLEDWRRRIEAAEIEAAAAGAPRRKLYRREDFLAVLNEQRAAG